MKKRIISIFLALTMLLLLPLSTSCALFKGPISDEQLREMLTELLPKDAELTGYIWGDSFTTAKQPEEDDYDAYAPIYYAVSADAPYKSVKALKSEVEKIYSSELTQIICEYAFESSDLVMSRFCDDVDDKGNVIGLRMDVTKNHKPYELTAVAIISTAKVKRSTNFMVEGTLTIKAGKAQTEREMKIKLLKENDVWKIDSQTWLAGVE